ncbi:MAG: hypothetical protein MO846_09855 [Candidatus Devosia symbiotica]|nr:hypothetical protein [Candidatus Devosia symbiotica]
MARAEHDLVFRSIEVEFGTDFNAGTASADNIGQHVLNTGAHEVLVV